VISYDGNLQEISYPILGIDARNSHRHRLFKAKVKLVIGQLQLVYK